MERRGEGKREERKGEGRDRVQISILFACTGTCFIWFQFYAHGRFCAHINSVVCVIKYACIYKVTWTIIMKNFILN